MGWEEFYMSSASLTAIVREKSGKNAEKKGLHQE